MTDNFAIERFFCEVSEGSENSEKIQEVTLVTPGLKYFLHDPLVEKLYQVGEPQGVKHEKNDINKDFVSYVK